MWENRYNPIPYYGGHTNGATAYVEEDGKDVAYVNTIHFFLKYTVNDVNDASIKPENWTPTVPIPAAGWLFGSALIGLVGMSRRRKRV